MFLYQFLVIYLIIRCLSAIKITPATTTTTTKITNISAAIETTTNTIIDTNITIQKLTEITSNSSKTNYNENLTNITENFNASLSVNFANTTPVNEVKHLKNFIKILQTNQESCSCEFHCGVCCCNGLCDYFNLITCEIQIPIKEKPNTDLKMKLWSLLLLCRNKNSDYWCNSEKKDSMDDLTADEKREVCFKNFN